MIRARVFSEQGIEKFREYIQNLKTNQQVARPNLNCEPYSLEFQLPVEIDETKIFNSRMEIGRYLKECFEKSGVSRADVIGNRGMWTWLAYLWFDQLCPVMSGRRNVRETARYICSSDYTDYYRHYVAASYDIYSLHGEQNSRLFLYNEVYQHNDFIEQIASKQEIISSRPLIDVLHRLYWDAGSNRPKRGAQSKNKPGNIRRYKKIAGQLELTYDIYNMRADEILRLLPPEFNEWKR